MTHRAAAPSDGLSAQAYATLVAAFSRRGAHHGYNLVDMPDLGAVPPRKAFRLTEARLDRAAQTGDSIDAVFARDGRAAALAQAREEAASPPPWIDRDAVSRGQRVGRRYFSCLAMTLGNLSLIGGFGASKINRVLVRGSRLSMQSKGRGYDPLPRLVETSAWLLEALRGVEPGDKGHEETIQVRALHAMIRHHLVSHGWDDAALDHPINQEQMLATLMGFAYNGVWGLRRMGIRLTDREAEDTIILWSYIGHLLGMDDDLLPRNLDEARAATLQIIPRLIDPDDETREIIANLRNRRESRLGLPPSVQAAMCRFYMPHRYADRLGLEGHPLVDALVAMGYRGLGRVVSTVGRHRPDALEAWEVERVSRRLEFVLDSIRQGKTPSPRPSDPIGRSLHTLRGVSRAVLSL